MKKFIYLAAIALTGIGFTACNSDDNKDAQAAVNPLVGTWEATTVTYTHPGGTNTHAFKDIKSGCKVDVLVITADQAAALSVENKAEAANDCKAETLKATWTDKAIAVTGEEKAREVLSVNDKELVLKYGMTFGNFGTTDVDVVYTKK